MLVPEVAPQMITSTNPDVRLAVRVFPGIGPHIVMLHGIGSSSQAFGSVIDEMTSFCQPITIDLRGHGDSSKPDRGYHYRDYTDDLNSVIKTLCLSNPIVLGHSLGGLITLLWALEHPDIPRALIIEDSPLRSGREFREVFDGWLILNALPLPAARAWYSTKNSDWPDELLDQRALDMTSTARNAIRELRALSLRKKGFDSLDPLASISSPLLFMQGNPNKGGMVEWEDLATLQHVVPQTEIRLFGESGHTIHRDQPQDWLAMVRTFIENLPD